VLSLEELVKLLHAQRLMLGQVDEEDGELLR